jgi:hypothetical protein
MRAKNASHSKNLAKLKGCLKLHQWHMDCFTGMQHAADKRGTELELEQ